MSDDPYDFQYAPYSGFTAVDKQRVLQLIISGGEVEAATLPNFLPSCPLLGVARADERIVAVAAIKGLRTPHNRGIAKRSAYPLSDTSLEFGYAVTEPEHRHQGLGGDLCHSLVHKASGSLFATTRAENDPMGHILEGCAFTRVGTPWDSIEHPESDLVLWVHDRVAFDLSLALTPLAHASSATIESPDLFDEASPRRAPVTPFEADIDDFEACPQCSSSVQVDSGSYTCTGISQHQLVLEHGVFKPKRPDLNIRSF